MLATLIEQEYIQWGFASFSFAMLWIIVWMFKQLIAVVNKNNGVLAKLIDAIKLQEKTDHETRESVERFRVETKHEITALSTEVTGMRERLMTRPCVLPRAGE